MLNSKTLRIDSNPAEIYNVMGTLRIRKPDIGKIANHLKGCIYEPPGPYTLDVRIGRCLFRIYHTGRISCFGNSQETVTRSALELLRSLRDTGVSVPKKPTINFCSVASVMRLGRKIRLWKARYLLRGSEFSAKGPRLLSYRLSKPKVTLQLFENGTIRCLGARSERDSKRAFSRIVRLIKELGLSI